MLPAFTKYPVPVIRESDQERSGWGTRDASIRWHTVGTFRHIGGGDLSKSQEVFEKGLSKVSRVIAFCAFGEAQYSHIVAAHVVFCIIRLSDQHADSLLERLQNLGML